MTLGREAFPPTRLSLLEAVRSGDGDARRLALDALSRAYWQPTRAYLRLRWRVEEDATQDLTQDFFANAFERDLFARYDVTRARFRTFLRVCLDRFVANEWKAAARLKRGGGAIVVPLDDVAASDPGALAAGGDDADAIFHREWVRWVFGEAVDRLRAQCDERGKQTHFEIFRRYDLEGPQAEDPPSYASLAEQFDLPVTQVTNHLHFCRREFRAHVLAVLRERSPTDEDYRQDVRDLLGLNVP